MHQAPKIREFKLGQKAKVKYEISPIRSLEVDSTILWAEDDRICLDFPIIYMDDAQFFFEGQEIEVTLYTDKGIRNYESIVIYSPLEGDFIIEYYEDASKIQRRQFVRADSICDLILYKGKDSFKTKTLNIGGGGLRFTSAKDLTLNDTYEFSLYLPKKHLPIKGTCEILYRFPKEGMDHYVLEFRAIRETERNKIIKVCFEIEAAEYQRQNQ